MKNLRPLIYASAVVLLAFISVGLSSPHCEDGTIKLFLSNLVLYGSFPLAGVYLGLKSKKNNLIAYAFWGLLFSIPAMSGYLYFAFGPEHCTPRLHNLGETLKRGFPLFTLFATGIPLILTYTIKNRRS